ncbi:Luminal-binding protein 5 [Hypsibius exemplaris]|uniref:Luminal-binding protein 5 n=1 Tax=Hypsibius exemplaris TaxID=2072580 RepID=A0A9X6NF54_HYPEX|nr:Luminal-binding protein 5 [Hypsibius exemplaris]
MHIVALASFCHALHVAQVADRHHTADEEVERYSNYQTTHVYCFNEDPSKAWKKLHHRKISHQGSRPRMSAEVENLLSNDAVGIDLGTTNSAVAAWVDGRAFVLANCFGSRLTPSCVSYDFGECEVGEIAKENSFDGTVDTIHTIKRIIGRTFAEEEVQRHASRWPFTVIDRGDGKPVVRLSNGQCKSPEDISAEVLKALLQTAKVQLKRPVSRAVISVPANFTHAQREATKRAAVLAGLEVIALINEPTAAAIAYGISHSQGSQTILVFDLGGGTLDVSVVKTGSDDAGRRTIQVLCTDGDSSLGGLDFDERIYQWLLGAFETRHGLGIRENPRAVSRLRSHAEAVKFTLSGEGILHAVVALPALHNGIDFKETLSREVFEVACQDLFARLTCPIEYCLKFKQLMTSDIDQVVLVGGCSRIPKVREIVQAYFAGRPVYRDIHPDEAVALGAATYARCLASAGSCPELMLLDVTSHSIGIELADGTYSTVVGKFSALSAASRTVLVTTVEDYQTVVVLRIYEGDDRRLRHNCYLGQLTLSGLTPADAGKTIVSVVFQLNASSLLSISAVEVCDTTTATASGMEISLDIS